MGADVVCIGEGEETVLELAAGKKLSAILGIAYLDASGNFFINERRPLIANLDAIPFAAYHRFPIEVYRLLRMPRCSTADFAIPILSGRGCTFKCNFCYRMDKGFRARSNDIIIEEMMMLKKNYGITYIAFYDELLMSSTSRIVSLCEDMIKHKVQMTWECNGRLNYAKPGILKLMREAGCVFINYGIECLDDATLRRMHKGLTVSQITRGIEATLAAGISPGFNIIFGNIDENRRTLQQGVDFLLKYDDGAQLRTIRPVTPYPGCELYYQALESGKLKDCEDFYENKHINSDLLSVNFTQLSDDEFYDALHGANAQLIQNYDKKHGINIQKQLHALYQEKNASFRGFRHG